MTYHLAERKINQSYHIRVTQLANSWAQECRPERLRVLEIGVGRGNIPKLLRDSYAGKRLEYFGADIELDNLLKLVADKTLDGYLLFESGDISEFRFEGEKFDLLIMSHVLEHVENPKQFLKHAQDIFLKPAGAAIIAVPNSARPDCLVNSLIGRHYSNAGHYYSWDKSHWRRFVEDRCGEKEAAHYSDGIALPVPRKVRDVPGVGPAVLACELFLGKLLPGWSFSNVTVLRQDG